MSQTDEKQGEVVTLLPPTTRINLHDAHAIRRELASVYRDMRSGKIDSSDGTKLGYVLNMLLRAYESCVLQEKIESIETVITTRSKDANEKNKRKVYRRVLRYSQIYILWF